MSATESLRILAERCAAAPAAVSTALRAPQPDLPAEWRDLPVTTTGLGSSQSAARLLVQRLTQAGIAAQYRPLSAFYTAHVAPDPGLLIVFSQGLSANAMVALAHREAFAGTVLVTSASADGLAAAGKHTAAALLGTLQNDPRCRVLSHPMENEYTILPRIIGPLCAMAASLQLAAALAPGRQDIPAVPAADITACTPDAADLDTWAAELLSGPDFYFTCPCADVSQHLAAKVMEGLFLPPPQCRDLFEYAHGPYQLNCRSAKPAWVFSSGSDEESELTRRISPLLPEPVRQIRSRLPAPYAIFAFDHFLNTVLCRAVAMTQTDLINWPGKGSDGPAYGISAPLRQDL